MAPLTVPLVVALVGCRVATGQYFLLFFFLSFTEAPGSSSSNSLILILSNPGSNSNSMEGLTGGVLQEGGSSKVEGGVSPQDKVKMEGEVIPGLGGGRDSTSPHLNSLDR